MYKTRTQNKKNQRNFSRKNSFSQGRQNRFKKSSKTIDPSVFVKKATSTEDTKYVAPRLITKLPVNKGIINNLIKKGYETPTQIQEKTLEPLMEGRNLVGIAHTGTGKTGAFLIPLINNLLNKKPASQVLVVAPTRELAVQTNNEFQSIAAGLKLYSNCLIGGTSVYADVRKLKKPSHFIIGTPGRLNDMVRQGAIKLKDFNTIVLDEFDRLLDMGFSQEINQLVDGMVNRRQTILFAATNDNSQKQIIDKLATDLVEVKVSNGSSTVDTVDQDIVRIKEGEKKLEILLDMIRDESFEKVLVFAETKRWVSRICKHLRQSGVKADEIHSDKSQNYRSKALNSFKKQNIQVLVATDVASRGLDISQVSHVINYQQPNNMESYIHRIGRTGRAGKSGKAITFVN